MSQTRREFALKALAMGALLAFAGGARSPLKWRERRDLFPQGVASGDPASDSVVLWTRRPPAPESTVSRVFVEVATDAKFRRIVASGVAELAAATDWTIRFLAGGLKPSTEYWYRFTDEYGFGSRVGRTLTTPAEGSSKTVRFTFVSCQLVTEGACNAYRRMVFEDQGKPRNEQLDFVLHLGDFIYEVVWYPDEHEGGLRRGRRLRDIFRYPDGDKLADFHFPASLEDYRTVYRAYLKDPDLQDARARWPFVCVWDNHEFSWQGWQSQQVFGGEVRPAQRMKIAANQAWWEFIPARVRTPAGESWHRFDAPLVVDAGLEQFDKDGLGAEPNNIAAISSLRINRSLRWGRNVELFLTDNHSFRTQPTADSEDLAPKGFRWANSDRVVEILDKGRAYANGAPPDTIRFAGKNVANPQKNSPPQGYLGAEQRAWLLDRLKSSTARWKIWGHSFGTLEWRSDYQNLPEDFALKWPDEGYALFNGGFYEEKGRIFDFIKENDIVGFAIVAGDRHSFWAGYASKSLPPESFEPVGVEFITGSISSPGIFEVAEHVIPADDATRPLFLCERSDGAILPSMNISALHGVRTALELKKSGDIDLARTARNPELSPHLKFLDLGGHGYGKVTVSETLLETEFVCIPRPFERSASEDGGPIAYRVVHSTPMWRPGNYPKMTQTVIEGDVSMCI